MIIVIEGIDCSGKSTQVELLEKYLANKFGAENIYNFHFPVRNSIFGQQIYEYLNKEVDYSKEVVELLHTADKMNEQSFIKEFKNNCNEFLILDRYKLSQYAYALASDLDKNWVKNLMSQMIEPDIKFFLNISPDKTLKRKEQLDKYETDMGFLNDVYNWYLVGCDDFNCKIIDATKSIEEIHREDGDRNPNDTRPREFTSNKDL